MSKIRRISELGEDANLEFGTFHFSQYWEGFLSSDLGQIYQAIPWSELVSVWGIKEKHFGPSSYFPPAGKIALMFLKHYSCCSDERLISHLNGSFHYQFFCGIWIDPTAPLLHRQLVSSIRSELSQSLPIDVLQQVLANYWKGHMSETENLLCDATCYESEVRYPTDPKLLWECVCWLHGRLRFWHKALGLRMPRTKHSKWVKVYGIYRRKRKPRVKHRKRVKGGLIRLLRKFLEITRELEQNHRGQINPKEGIRLQTIEKVYEQQYQLFTTGQKPKGRIISLAKDYLRPIVRGKENKPVEFGAKVNKIQIDGINFIEQISFDAFHEGNRLEQAIYTGRKLVGRVARIGADGIYATNANRSYCSSQKIFTDFRPKGRKGKWEAHNKALRKAISKERGSRLEGSFGNEKNAYHLRKVKARTKANEILWIFCGIHMANAREIGKRIARAKKKVVA